LFCRAWKIEQSIIPVTDDDVPTIVETDQGSLPFQEYFVKHQFRPPVKGFRFRNVENSKPAPGVLRAIEEAQLIVICPSNPWVSIDPIFAIPGVRSELLLKNNPIIAVSPIIGGKAIKGPAAKMFSEMGFQPSAIVVAEHYEDYLRGGPPFGFVLDEVDKNVSSEIEQRGVRSLVTNTIMETNFDKRQLAREVLEFRKELIN
jgi:LPPG:FO 2-phospho-L-lactate transferase